MRGLEAQNQPGISGKNVLLNKFSQIKSNQIHASTKVPLAHRRVETRIYQFILRYILQDLHPSQRPRWQVDKEAIDLPRVQQCSSTCNTPS